MNHCMNQQMKMQVNMEWNVEVYGLMISQKLRNVYLVGNHTPGYFIEGIIECPKEDVPYEQLGMIRPLNEENISPNTIALSDSTNQFHGVDMEQLSFRDYMRNNTDLETLQPTNDNEVVAARIEVVVEDLVEETRQVVFDKHGQAKLPF